MCGDHCAPPPPPKVTLGQEDQSADDDDGHDHELGRCEHVLDVATEPHAQRIHRSDEYWGGGGYILCQGSVSPFLSLLSIPPTSANNDLGRLRVMKKQAGPSPVLPWTACTPPPHTAPTAKEPR